MKYIFKRWKEDGIEKIGFWDTKGEFHMLFGVAKDWEKDTISALDLDTGNWTKYKIFGDFNNTNNKEGKQNGTNKIEDTNRYN